MPERASVSLPCAPVAAGLARQFVAQRCRDWQLEAFCADLTLPVSELVTNAVLHAGTPIQLTLIRGGDYVQVSVSDRNPRRPVMRPVRLDLDADIAVATHLSIDFPPDLRDQQLHVGDAGSISAGRGLHIVDAVADEWGVAELSEGKDVWFRIHTG